MVATFFFPSLAPVSGWRLPESLIFLARRLCHLKQQGCEMRTGEKKMGGCTIVEGWRWPRKSFSATHGEEAADVRRLDLSRTAPLSHLSQGLVTSQTNLGLYCITFQPGKLMGEGLCLGPRCKGGSYGGTGSSSGASALGEAKLSLLVSVVPNTSLDLQGRLLATIQEAALL